MSPPPAGDAVVDISSEMQSQDLNRLRWGGWVVLGSFVVPFVIWVAVSSHTTWVIKNQEELHYERLREDIGRVADDVADVKQLLQPKRFASRDE